MSTLRAKRYPAGTLYFRPFHGPLAIPSATVLSIQRKHLSISGQLRAARSRGTITFAFFASRNEIVVSGVAWSSGSLIPCIIGHVTIDIGLFAYWWTGIAGDFRERPISETGLDQAFFVAVAIFVISLFAVLFAMSKAAAHASSHGLTRPGLSLRKRAFPRSAKRLVESTTGSSVKSEHLGSPNVYLCKCPLKENQ